MADYDNDDYPDLFLNNFGGDARLYHNNRNGTFTDVTESMGVDGPQIGFSCWAWDYDNDGFQDIFATCFDYSIEDMVKGMIGQRHKRLSNRLWHNVKGKRFENKTKEAGLDLVFAAMGSNFADFDNDGFLDFYLGTGEPSLSTLVPNRMFKNVEGHSIRGDHGQLRNGQSPERPRSRMRRLGPRRRCRPLHRDGRRRRGRPVSQHPVSEPRDRVTTG